MSKYKAMFKYELANEAGVSATTFRKWLKRSEKNLLKFECIDNDNILPPGAVKFLCEKYGIVLDEDFK